MALIKFLGPNAPSACVPGVGILEVREHMASVDIQLPADLVVAAKLDQGSDVSREAAKLIALELFREDEVSLGRAAEFCRMPIEAFMEYAGEHGAPLHYGLEELEQDRRNIARLGLSAADFAITAAT